MFDLSVNVTLFRQRKIFQRNNLQYIRASALKAIKSIDYVKFYLILTVLLNRHQIFRLIIRYSVILRYYFIETAVSSLNEVPVWTEFCRNLCRSLPQDQSAGAVHFKT